MARAVNQRELEPVDARFLQMRRQVDAERREAEVESDASFPALRILVETGRTGDGAQRLRKARLAAVDMTQHANVQVQCAGRHRHLTFRRIYKKN